MLQQLDENNREIEGQRYEIKRLREQVQILLQRAPLADNTFMDVMGLGGVPMTTGLEEDQRAQSAAPLQRPGSTPAPGMAGRDMRERSKSSMAAKR